MGKCVLGYLRFLLLFSLWGNAKPKTAINWFCIFVVRFFVLAVRFQTATRRMASSTSLPESVLRK